MTYYTTKEIAEMLKVSQMTVWRWLKSGELRGIKTGKNSYRIPEKDLENFLKKRRTK